MATLQIRDMPEYLFDALKLRAQRDHRSLAQEAIVLLTQALMKQGRESAPRNDAVNKIRSSKVNETFSDLNIVEIMREDRNR